MKILLVQPPFTIFKREAKKCHPPLGLAYLAAVLKDKCEVSILDALAEGYAEEEVIDRCLLRYGLPFNNIRKRIEQIKPDIIGVSCLFSAQSENAHKICAVAKEIDKGIVTILGGAHPSALPEVVLKDKNVDFVVIGEGEDTIVNLLECLEKEKYSEIQDIEGVGFRFNGSTTINLKIKYREVLDGLPFPDWNLFPLEKYFKVNNPHGGAARRVPFLPVVTSRGCPFECIFCSVHNLWGRNYRGRSVENVLLELDYLKNNFGVKEILFEDDNLTLNKDRAKRIFQCMIDRNLQLSWSLPNGVAAQSLDDDMLELMKNSGCHSISLGVESGDKAILEGIIRKPLNLGKAKSIIKKANKLGLETTAFFVVGLPQEGRVQLNNTFKFAEKINADNINFFFATPLPGTRLLDLCKKKGLIDGACNYTYLKSDYPVFANEEFSIQELQSIVFNEKIKIYFLYFLRNPKKFLFKICQKILNDPQYFLRFGLKHFSKKC